MVHTQKLQIQSLMPAKFAVKDGPFVQALDASLNSCGVDQQVYHGGSFVGNHVHEYLKVGLNTIEEYIEHWNNIYIYIMLNVAWQDQEAYRHTTECGRDTRSVASGSQKSEWKIPEVINTLLKVPQHLQ